jgi:hypothetical protein
MSRVEAAAGMDRLPWLPDEPQAKPVKRRRPVIMWAAVVILLVASGGFWFGLNNGHEPRLIEPRRQPAATTVRLPEPRPAPPEVRIAPQPQVRLTPTPQVRPAPSREVRIAAGPIVHKSAHAAPSAPEKPATAVAAERPTPTPPVATSTVPPAQPFVMPRPWQPRVVVGAAGRLVQVGAFGSVSQAKLGWRYMVRAYPAMAHLPAVVRPDRNSKGRLFYRFRVGTTSQAHSEVLCQRMETIHLSCAVVGLPWKAKVER